jgi:hypothetical protein
VAGSCEHGIEPPGSTECGEFLDWLSVLLVSQEGLSSMGLLLLLLLLLLFENKREKSRSREEQEE